MTALLLHRIPAERAGTASGVLNASRRIGGALLLVAVFGALVADRAMFFDAACAPACLRPRCWSSCPPR